MATRYVELVEVSPRDGLQNESVILDTDAKVELINRAVAAGVRRLEAVSFVNPKRVPQMADAEAVMAALPERDDVTYIGLALNRRGLDRAIAAGCKEVNYALVASDAFSQRNQGTTVFEGVDVWHDIAGAAKEAGVRCSLTISVAFGCPFQGEVSPDVVYELVDRCAGPDTYEIALADTIGVAAPSQVRDMVGEVRRRLPNTRLRCHFHNTRNTGLANAYAAVEAGADTLDASIGGIGGCPFAPAATGNIPSEDLIYMLHRMGIRTGIDVEQLIEIAKWLEERLGRPVPAMLGRAGNFPPAEHRA
jgi:hydroxymethylglutaryl-CoA lyase